MKSSIIDRFKKEAEEKEQFYLLIRSYSIENFKKEMSNCIITVSPDPRISSIKKVVLKFSNATFSFMASNIELILLDAILSKTNHDEPHIKLEKLIILCNLNNLFHLNLINTLKFCINKKVDFFFFEHLIIELKHNHSVTLSNQVQDLIEFMIMCGNIQALIYFHETIPFHTTPKYWLEHSYMFIFENNNIDNFIDFFNKIKVYNIPAIKINLFEYLKNGAINYGNIINFFPEIIHFFFNEQNDLFKLNCIDKISIIDQILNYLNEIAQNHNLEKSALTTPELEFALGLYGTSGLPVVTVKLRENYLKLITIREKLILLNNSVQNEPEIKIL